MNGDMTIGTYLLASVTVLGGLAVGLVYFHVLRLAIARFAAGEGWLGPSLFTLARISGAVAAFLILARLGALLLLAGFLGFLLARQIALRTAVRVG